MKGVSIIICCYNSANRITETLKFISNIEVPNDIQCELIIVNNNSNDNTIEVVTNVWKKTRNAINLKIVDEKVPGLSEARKTGAKNSMYDFLIFCDDDNWLAPNYVTDVYSIFREHRNVGVIGGFGIAKTEIEKPIWFDKFQSSYAVTSQSEFSGIIDKAYVYGAGMAIRKIIFSKIEEANYKFLLEDRKGANLTAGNDGEICQIAILLGFKLYYSDKLTFIHFIPEERLSIDYLVKINEGFGKCAPILRQYEMINNKNNNIINTSWYYQVFRKYLSYLLEFDHDFENIKKKYKYQSLKCIKDLKKGYKQNFKKIENLQKKALVDFNTQC